MDKLYDVVIIGGGPAGYSAALYAARAGFSTVVIEKMAAGGQMALTDVIDNYPGFHDGVDGLTLGMQMQQGAERFGAETVYGEVTNVDLSAENKVVHTTMGDLAGKTLVIATGAQPRPLGLPDEEKFIGRGIHYCAHCDGRFYKDKTVVVVGGGNSAAADALYLSHIAKKVYVVHRRDTLRATRLYHKPLLDAENVTMLWNSTVTACTADKRVTAATVCDVQSGEQHTVECDGIFVSIGRNPVTAFLDGAVALDENGYIVADETTKTNVDGVFAVGDVRTKAMRQVITAAADGAVCVHFIEQYLAEKEGNIQ